MAVITIPLDSGINEGVDPRLMPQGKLRRVQNARLARDGQLRVRPGYSVLPATSYGAADMVAYDLVAYNDRLLALGDCLGLGYGYPTDVLALLDSGAAARWTPTTQLSTVTMGRITGARDIGSPPDQLGGARSWSVGASGGYVTLAWNNTSGAAFGYFMLLDPEHNQALFVERNDGTSNTPCHQIRVVADSQGDRSYVLGTSDTNAGLNVAIVIYATDKASSTHATVIGLGSDVTVFGSAPISGTDGLVFAAHLLDDRVVFRGETNNLGPRFTVTLTSTVATDVAVEADATDNKATLGIIVGGVPQLFTYNLTTGVEIGTGPHTAAGLTTGATRIAIVRRSATTLLVMCNTGAGGTDRIVFATYTTATQTFSAVSTIGGAQMASTPMVHSGAAILAIDWQELGGDSTPATLVSVDLDGTANPRLAPALGKDLEITSFDSDTLPEIVLDPQTGLYYWANAPVNNDGEPLPLATEMALGSSERRQTAQLGNLLYIAGGRLGQYDGRQLVEQGFLQRPVIVSATAESHSGSMTASGNYHYQMIWEWEDSDRNTVRSAPSPLVQVTLGGSDNAVALAIPAPTTLRRALSAVAMGSVVRARIYRTVDGGASLLLTATHAFTSAVELVTVHDVTSDAGLAGQEAIYVQAQTPLGNHASPPADRVAVGNGRIIVAGQPQRDRWEVSKPLQPSEPAAMAPPGIIAFSGRIRGDIEAVVAQGQSYLLFTRREVWVLSGSGPDLNGQGSFFPEQRLLVEGGMRVGGWRSIAETSQGTFFQLDDAKLYVLGGSSGVHWIGHDVQDTMDLYPVIVAAQHVAHQQMVAFALQNEAGDAGTLLLYDLRRQVWLEDPVGVVDSLAEYQGRIAYVQGGLVYLEDDAAGAGAVPSVLAETGSIPMASVLGAGGIERVLVLGIYQDDCTIELLASYDDGKTFVSCGVKVVTASAGFGVNQPVELEWMPAQSETGRIALRVVMSGAADSLACYLNAIEVHYQADEGPTRLGDARRR